MTTRLPTRPYWPLALAAVLALAAPHVPIDAQPAPAREGHLEILFRDAPDGTHERIALLREDDGSRTRLQIAPDAEAAFGAQHGSVYEWVGRRLRASGTATAAPPGFSAARLVAVTSLTPAARPAAGDPRASLPDTPRNLTGPQPWISILCKFSDVASEPRTVSYHQNLLGTVAPGMDQYWRQVSYNLVNIVGSQVVGWFTLPQPRSYYVYNNQLDFARAANDCTSVADAAVYFPTFNGINLMFNETLDCCAWGGGRFMTLDGVSKVYSMTWEPPWAQNPAVIAHEMGHGFGLPHSANDYGYTYGSSWDVMSNTYVRSDPTWTWIGQETISYHRDRLAWIAPGRIYTPGPGTNSTITLQRLNEPLSGSGYLMAKVPIRGTADLLTVEVRQKTGTYDVGLPATGVIVHAISPGRPEPAHVLDHDLDGDATDAGAALGVGGIYNHPSGIRITVVSAGAGAYNVRIRDGLPAARPLEFTGDGVSDLGVFRPSTGSWLVQGSAATALGVASDISVPGDYDGNRAVERAMYRPSTGEWFIQGQSPVAFGQPGDIPVPADYDGNGTTDVAVYRKGSWHIRNQPSRNWGLAGDVPVPADYDGDGHVDAAVYRRTTGHWLIEGGTDVPWGQPGDIPVPADYTGDGLAEIAAFRPSNATWYIRDVATLQLGAPGDIPIALDMDGFEGSEVVAYRPSTGAWQTYNLSTGSGATLFHGQIGDIPLGVRPGTLPRAYGDMDRDRRADHRVFRPSSGGWFTWKSGEALAQVDTFGLNGDIPVSGDFDGDGRPDAAVFRPGTGGWYTKSSMTGAGQAFIWGTAGDIPVPADYDDDGRSDWAVFRPSNGTWYVRYSGQASPATHARTFGTAGDIPQAGDYDGDGRADYAVFRPSNSTWYVLRSSTNFASATAQAFGTTGDLPVAADWDGDGRVDVAVFRPGNGAWYLRRSWNGAMEALPQWGAPTDIPVPADFDGDGAMDPTVFRPGSGVWYTRTRLGAVLQRAWGTGTDIPLIQPR